MSPQYGELRPTNGRDRFRSLWHPSKFQRVSCLAFVTAVTSLNGPQPNYARCMAASCDVTLYIYTFSGGSCPLWEFCQVQNSLYVQVLHSPILAALLHGTQVVGISQTLRHRTTNGIMELLQRAHMQSIIAVRNNVRIIDVHLTTIANIPNPYQY